MKDNEFIELLNLYLDHEISPADAARLEAEVQRTPARYRMYRDYCVMHKGCTLLAADFATEAPAAAAYEAESRGWRNPFAITAGLAAAAACVGFVFLNSSSQSSLPETNSPVIAQQAVVPATAPSVASIKTSENPRSIAPTVTVVTHRVTAPSTLTTHTLRLTADELAPAPVQDVRLEWIESLQLSSVPQVPIDSLRFETKAPLKTNPRNFGPGPAQSPTEYNAIQFQR